MPHGEPVNLKSRPVDMRLCLDKYLSINTYRETATRDEIFDIIVGGRRPLLIYLPPRTYYNSIASKFQPATENPIQANAHITHIYIYIETSSDYQK